MIWLYDFKFFFMFYFLIFDVMFYCRISLYNLYYMDIIHLIIIVIIWFGGTVTLLYKLKSASYVSLTNYPHPFLQRAFHWVLFCSYELGEYDYLIVGIIILFCYSVNHVLKYMLSIYNVVCYIMKRHLNLNYLWNIKESSHMAKALMWMF